MDGGLDGESDEVQGSGVWDLVFCECTKCERTLFFANPQYVNFQMEEW